MEYEKIKEELKKIVGESCVFDDEETLRKYSCDMTEIEGKMPDFVVKSTSTIEIQKIVNLANEYKIPITPAVARTNLGGLTIPTEGGIVLDLTDMNKIIEVKKEEMYAIIEPGVSYQQIKEHLDKNFPELRFAYPLSPPNTSIVANCLLDGLANISLKHGSTSEWIQGIEAVLPNGEIIKSGSCAVSPFWFSRAPLPDLTGLFISWQGTTGIVTKMAISLFPKLKFRYRVFIMFYEMETAFEVMKKFSYSGVFDDIGGLSWTCGKLLFGVKNPVQRDPDEVEFYVYADISANTRREMRAKKDVIEGILKDFKNILFEGPFPVDDILKIDKAFDKFAEFPTYLDFLLDTPGGGLTWIGTYGPISNWAEGARKCSDLMIERGFPPTIVSRPMKGGHFVILRLITIFDKKNKEEVERVRKLNNDICDIILNLGFIPYKTPIWIVKKFMDRIDKNYYETLKKIKSTLDPNRIMNPGKWLL